MAANKLVVGGLPLDISEEELQTVFSTYGEVLAIQIQGQDHGGVRQAHVTYRETKSAEDAITVLHDIYKIRTDAERPIQVYWFKEDVVMASPGAPVAPAAGDWGGAPKQETPGWGAAPPPAAGGGPPTKAPEDSHKIFVGGLPDDISEDELRTVFGTYGEVAHTHIMKPNSMTGLRGAFVFYVKRESGEDAIKVLDNNYKIRTDAENPIQVRWGKDGKGEGKGKSEQYHEASDPNNMPNKLFVGSLPPDITEDEIRHVFGTYGEVAKVHLMAPHASTNLRAALVFYARRESGEDAIKVLHEVYKFREDAESAIQVKWGKEGNSKGYDGKGKGGGKGWDNNWGGDSWRGDSWGGGKGGGGKGWQALGNGWDDRSGRGSWDSKSNWWEDSRSGGWNDGWRDGGWSGSSGGGKGWGGNDWGGKGKGDKGGYDKGGKGGKGGDKGGYDRGYGDKGYDKGGKGDMGKGKGKGEPEATGKLFVANLPEDIQDNALTYVFGTYGKVEKVHIMANQSRNGRIAAFVEFGTPEEAETAIASLNEKYEIRQGFGPIMVRHANARRPKPY